MSLPEVADRAEETPIAARLDFGEAAIWIVAGAEREWPPDGQFWLGADEVMVVFTRDFAQTLKLVQIDDDPQR